MSTRVGIPAGVKGLVEEIENPSYSVAMGLLLYGAKEGGEEIASRSGFNPASLFSKLPTKSLKFLEKLPKLFKSLLP
jgi:cell division ATPase FtsA